MALNHPHPHPGLQRSPFLPPTGCNRPTACAMPSHRQAPPHHIPDCQGTCLSMPPRSCHPALHVLLPHILSMTCSSVQQHIPACSNAICNSSFFSCFLFSLPAHPVLQHHTTSVALRLKKILIQSSQHALNKHRRSGHPALMSPLKPPKQPGWHPSTSVASLQAQDVWSPDAQG